MYESWNKLCKQSKRGTGEMDAGVCHSIMGIVHRASRDNEHVS